MFCEEVVFSELAQIKLNPQSSKRLEQDFLENFYETFWNVYPEPEIALRFLENRYFLKKELKKGIQVLEHLLRLDSENPVHYYRLGCLYASLKMKEKAFQALESAITLGFHDKELLENEEMLDFLRGEDSFKALLNKLSS
ncbi:MAG: hypothetical protein AABZ60_23755 [Planctomycetota bacterium]